MRVIKEANHIIAKLWRDGKIQSSTYRIMKYIITVAVDDRMLLHNAITGEMIYLDREEMDNVSSLPCSYAPWMDELIQKHFLVRSESDDKKTVDTLRIALKMTQGSKDITGYTVLPTTNCNARCFYCYEAGCKHENMTDETADRLVDFMDAHRGGKTISIGWFGGEPLVGIKQIDRICKALKEKDILFQSNMISNGYFFDEKIAERVKPEWNLEKIQITLDGTEKVYNTTKAYINPCKSPYKKVLDNIGYLIKNKINVSIRLNLGMHNYDDLSTLIDELGKRFEDRTYLNVYIHILFENCGYDPTSFNATELDFLYERKAELENQIAGYGMVTKVEKLPKLIHNWCMSDNPSSVIVAPSGMLGKCEHYCDKHFVGNLETGITDSQEMDSLSERVTYPECDDCPLYPSCIKLKLCQDNTCSQRDVQEKMKKVMRSMRICYEDYLRKGHVDEAEHCEEPNC